MTRAIKLKRSKAIRTPPDPLAGKGKRSILELLAEYFILRPSDVIRIGKGREPSADDQRWPRYLMGSLFEAGYLSRLPYIDPETQLIGRAYVYGLSDKGVEAAPDLTGRCGWPKTFDDHSQRTLDHELEITRFHIELKRFVEYKRWKLYWQQSDLDCDIRPDAYFAITNDKGTYHFFLEMERAKNGHYKNGEPSIMRKLGKYYEYYGSDACQKEWDFRQFRTVVVLRTDERVTNLALALGKQYNHRTFWLTSEPAYRDQIGVKIFRTPKGDLFSLLDI